MQMATSLNRYSFHCIHMLTLFCIKTNPRENRFFAAKWAIDGKKGTHNVKFSTENLTKIIILHARASGQRRRKHVGLQQPARAVVGHVAHDKPRRHYGKAEVICYREPGFQHVENAWNNFRQVAFWNITTFCHKQFGAIFQVFIVSSSSTLCMTECLSWFYHTKKINSTQFIEPLKVKTTSLKEVNMNAFFPLLFCTINKNS